MNTLALTLWGAWGIAAWGQAVIGQRPIPREWTDPQRAAAECPDFLVQGEYGFNRPGEPWGLQVAALGDGQFRACLLDGGLPGLGAARDRPRWELQGLTDGAATRLGDAKGQVRVTLEAGVATVEFADREPVQLPRLERFSPTLAAPPPPGAVVLYDGVRGDVSADAWIDGQVEDGCLVNSDATSKQQFRDYTLHLEFRTPFKPYARGQARGNSGVYHQARFETQVLDSFALEGRRNEAGGIYGVADPLLNMCLPPLVWQTYDVDFRAARFDATGALQQLPRITVRLNGVVVQDDVELPRATPAARRQGIADDMGPIYLQRHGNPVLYRNIWVLPHGAPELMREVYLRRGMRQRGAAPLPRDTLLMRVVRAGDEPLNLRDDPADEGEAFGGAGTGAVVGSETVDAPPPPAGGWQRRELTPEGRWDAEGRQRGGYLYAPFEAPERRVMLLRAAGLAWTALNGELRGSDTYARDDVPLPVLLRPGLNELVARLSGRGQPRIALEEPPASVFLTTHDVTLPDLVRDRPLDAWGAVIVVNATPQTQQALHLSVQGAGTSAVRVDVPAISPLTLRKVGFPLRCEAPGLEASRTVSVQLFQAEQAVGPSRELSLRVRTPDQVVKRTFVSAVDGSVQYYALREASPPTAGTELPGLLLTCHGASVEATGHAQSYASKPWLHIVAPTNRRPFGFDWEDVGRLDALEALADAAATLPHDPHRAYLSGHSMGGHGAWHLATTYPDRFAAVGPSAGWLSYASYVPGEQPAQTGDPLEELLQRGAHEGDAYLLATNLAPLGVYAVHGDADDNVPPSQAQRMVERLAEFHRDWTLHLEPGQGHWWSHPSSDGGAACVDWPPMFELFARRVLPPSVAVRTIDFTTVNPGVSSQSHWVQIMLQQRQQLPSRVQLTAWPREGRLEGTTSNVARLRIDASWAPDDKPLRATLDGQTLEELSLAAGDRTLWLQRTSEGWRAAAAPPAASKGPHRYGGVKHALQQRVLFVVGTQGAAAGVDWRYAKARYDAEAYWRRGNASIELIADTDFDPTEHRDRSVVLYGNADENAVWQLLLADSPLQVRTGEIRLGERVYAGDDLSACFVRPHADSDVASVVAIAGTGDLGTRATNLMSLFVPFVRYPDIVIFRAAAEGEASPSPLVAGFWGSEWSLNDAEIAERDEP